MNCIYYVFLLNRLSNNHKGKATFYKNVVEITMVSL